jgi:hypothetical protein
MRIINRLLSTSLFIGLTASTIFAQANTVSATITQIATDSLGPWINNIQEIDSMDASGSLVSKSKRVWTGTNWAESRSESFLYNPSGQTTEHVKSVYDGNSYIPQIKTEYTYNLSGTLSLEVLFQYSSNNWIPITKHEHTYSQQPDDHLIISYTHSAGNWIYTDQHTLTSNTNGHIISDLHKRWNGSLWENVMLKTYTYDSGSNNPSHDSTFYYTTSTFLLQHSTNYLYSSSGKIIQTISRDFYSYLYSDPDTSYIETELDFEYSKYFVYNSQDLLTEQHGNQTRGSSQAWTYEHNYFQYDGLGTPVLRFMHSGTNLSESYSRLSTYNYAVMSAAFSSAGTSCIGCANGSIDVSANGGVAPYQLQLQTGNGIISGMHISNLIAGTYYVCLTDAIGNELCREIQIHEYSSGLDETGSSQAAFIIKNHLNEQELSIEPRMSNTFNCMIYDNTGRIIKSHFTLSGRTLLSTDELSQGLYFYSVFDTNEQVNGSFMILGK